MIFAIVKASAPLSCLASPRLVTATLPRRRNQAQVLCKAAAADSSDDEDIVRKERRGDEYINPATGNPQTGKLIDVYFEIGSLLVVVLLSFWSLWNVDHILKQTGSADKMREPAPVQEWAARDAQPVYGPCGGASDADDAMDHLLSGKPCSPSDYNRLPHAKQMST